MSIKFKYRMHSFDILMHEPVYYINVNGFCHESHFKMAALANQTLTIAMYCVAGYVWNTPAKDGGVYWHSKGSYMIKEMGSQVSITKPRWLKH